MEPTKKLSVHFRDSGSGRSAGERGGKRDETTKSHSQRNGVGLRKMGENSGNETNGFPPFLSLHDPPTKSLESQGSNTLPGPKRPHELRTHEELQQQQQRPEQKQQQSKTLPRARAIPSLGRNEAGSDDDKPRGRKGSNFLQMFSLKDQTHKRTRSDPQQQQRKSKSDSEAQRLNVLGAFGVGVQAEEDRISHESGVKKKKSKRERFRKGVERMVSLKKDKDKEKDKQLSK